ncbi:cardiac-enriched FHL2-interacting protein [Callorhinchus milii]|uniref:cardiac-enriched FHL2-interacting protein n=1 Tax=Callorhinchus milii TaxID=7868 RepID=UPI001C3FC12E|nr:cardiac-enriched FHL2-interacting protein [Callorhinchus milii]XP_007902761.2 cardiac-enriched FHL2-interacting protein [Callorhinchus milii]XP_007902762.2 cardiac-enriched FHL2-interacting protein [Callorhinchus milii]XP_007902763.2 cardiac-enriched FHL2-interacting protein [Callorhinchus milii]XP_007902764.2 cardiac-enriched FHL2-interacting protein [Callorhinchus milii]XP_007902765.2 cardiac-enriched FHL2-interacting protein [Callorhinchus milii]XP_042192988.1 cardiac-enriched FHL2-inte
MNFLDNVCTSGTGKMPGRSKHVDSFSDTSSVGSGLDEADREVSSLTERAFKSLCVAEEGMCHDSDEVPSPCGNYPSGRPCSERRKGCPSETKKCSAPPAPVKKRPKDLPETFQESAAQSLALGQSMGAKHITGNGFVSEAVGSCWKSGKQKVASLIEAFDQNERNSAQHLMLSTRGHHKTSEGSRAIEDLAHWDTSAIINMHKELSSFSATCQENYWLSKQEAQEKGSKWSPMGRKRDSQLRKHLRLPDMAALKHCTNRLDQCKSEKANKMKQLASKNSFLHSEYSAFRSWQDHSKCMFENEDCMEQLNHLEPNVQMQSFCDGALSFGHPDVQSPVEHAVSECLPGCKDPCEPWAVPVDFNSGARENHVEECNLQVLGLDGIRSKGNSEEISPQPLITLRDGLGEKWRDTAMVREALEISRKDPCSPKSQCGSDVKVIDEQVPPAQSPTFSISKLLKPNIVRNMGEGDASERQPIIVTPPLVPLRADEARGAAECRTRESYKSKASSLLYNLKDVRKLVKCTYSSALTPQSLSEQSKRNDYSFYDEQPGHERTASVPPGLAVGQSDPNTSNVQEKPEKIPSVSIRTAYSASNPAVNHTVESDMFKNDDYLCLSSPQTIKEAGSYPSWRGRNTRRSQSAMATTDHQVQRGSDTKVAHHPNKSTVGKKPKQPSSDPQGNSSHWNVRSEEAEAVKGKPEERLGKVHHHTKPSLGQRDKETCHTEKHHVMRNELLAQKREEEVQALPMDNKVPTNRIPSHSTREAPTLGLKSSHQSYFALLDERHREAEQEAVESTVERNGRTMAEASKDLEKSDLLQYYALSDPEGGCEKKAESNYLPVDFQEERSRDSLGDKLRGSCSLDSLCDEMSQGNVSRQEMSRPGSSVRGSPRVTMFKIKDNTFKASPVTKSVRPTFPKTGSDDIEENAWKETPSRYRGEERLDGDKAEADVEAEEMTPRSSVNPRPHSAAKPPVVPPKSEKALRRAQKLTSRRKKSEGKQWKQGTQDAKAETAPPVAKVTETPKRVSPLPLPVVCSPVPTMQLDPHLIPTVPNIVALKSGQSVAPIHSFPLTQRKLLQDPETGQYFVVDIPIQVQTKTLYDPETGTYFQVSIPSSGRNPSSVSSLDYFNTSYVLYPGFLSFPLASLPTVRSSSQMSAPAVLLDVQEEAESLNEWTGEDFRQTEEEGSQPYIETFYDAPDVDEAGIEGETQCSEMNNGLQSETPDLELIITGDLEDIASENT